MFIVPQVIRSARLIGVVLAVSGTGAVFGAPSDTNTTAVTTGAVEAADAVLIDSAETNTPGSEASAETETFIDYIASSNRWDKWHKGWSSNVVGVAGYIDQFFGSRTFDEETNETRLKLRLGVEFKEANKPEFLHKASLKLSLPQLDERVQLVFNDLLDSDEQPYNLNDPVNSRGDEDEDGAAIRYNLWKAIDVKVDADLGVRVESPLQVYLRLRGRRDFQITRKLELRLIQTVRWFTSDGFVSQTEMQWNRRMGWDWLFRSSSQLEWREDRSGIRPSQVFSVFKTFSRHRAIRMDIGATWPEVPNTTERLYYSTFTFRKLIHSNWLFMELKPGIQFYEPLDYDPQYVFAIQFEVMLGNLGLRRD